MAKRIWILSELYYPEEAATGYYVTRIAERLAPAFSVNVLCAQPTYLARGTKAPKVEMHNGVNIRRCAGTTLNKDNLLFRSVNLVTISLSILFRTLMSLRRGDVVFSVTNPPTLPFVAAIACRFHGAQLVLKIEDLYPDALVAAGVLAAGSILTRVFDRLQKALYGFSTRIVVLGRDTEEKLRNRYPEIAGKLTRISHWADIAAVFPRPRKENELLRRLGLSDKFVVQYSGTMGRTHDIESIVECAAILQTEERIHFLLIGWGSKESWLRAACSQRRLRNVTILQPLARGELCTSLNGADVAVIALVPDMLGVSVPSRIYNILAAGKPLIVAAHEHSEIARVVREENVGWVVPPRSPELLAHAVMNASQSSEKLCTMSATARKVAEEKYSGSDGYLALFESLAR